MIFMKRAAEYLSHRPIIRKCSDYNHPDFITN